MVPQGRFFILGGNATILHNFWSHVLAMIKKIKGFYVPKDPAIILLNIWDQVPIPDDEGFGIFVVNDCQNNNVLLEKAYSTHY